MKKLHLVAHTHWDREWYKPFQYFRTKLIYVVDRLIEILENDATFNSFMLDGQTIVLDDYLAIKPENKSRLEKLIRAGRLLVGPWYIQPDEFAPSAESLVRNLMMGIRQAESFGKSMMVGYLPDSFGHSAQMPQLLRGFGIDSAVLMRGVDFDKIGTTEFSWTGLNGDTVLGIYLIKGYMNAMFLSKDNDINRHRLYKLAEDLSEHTLCDRVLIMNGIDHAFAQPQVSGLCSGDKMIELGTLEQYTETAVVQTAGRLPGLGGELLTPRHHRVHSSIASSRMHQKIENRRLSALLERSCEPVCAAAMLCGVDYPAELIQHAWKKLISNQTHDGICGCCTDEVHREMDQRFTEVEQIVRSLINSHGRALSSKIDPDGASLIVFNSAMRAGSAYVEAEVFCESDFRLLDENGNECDYQIISKEKTDLARLSIWTLYLGKPQPSFRYRILFRCSFDSFFGYRIFRIVPPAENDKNTPAIRPEAGRKGDYVFRNDYYSLKIELCGSITLTDYTSGRHFSGLCVIEDCGEGGDTYNHSPLQADIPVYSSDARAVVECLAEGPLYTRFLIKHCLQVPLSLNDEGSGRSDETVELPVRIYMNCYKSSRRIDFSAEIENNAFSHRIRILFPFDQLVEKSFAETQFGIIERDTASPLCGCDWPEKPLPIYSMQRLSGVSSEGCSMLVLNRGLTEYEVYQQACSVLAITLHRGVSMMGKPNLAIRPGRASGIEVPTPDAEEIGLIKRDFSLIIGDSIDYASAIAEADYYTAPPAAFMSRLNLKDIVAAESSFLKSTSIDNLQSVIAERISAPALLSRDLLKISSKRIAVSAVKKAEDDNSIVVRLYNPGKSPVSDAVLTVGFKHVGVELTNLNEYNGSILRAQSEDSYILPAFGIAGQLTLRILRERTTHEERD